MESELIQAINSITESVNALAQPRCIDWLAVILSFFSVVLSVAAIWFAVQVPKKIADRQDKIALFEKRYECFQIFQKCFILYKYSIGEESIEKITKQCYHILEIQKVEELNNHHFQRKIEQIEYILHQMVFLFPTIQDQDVSDLYESLSAYLYAIMTHKKFEESKQAYIDSMIKFGKYVDEIWDSMTISNIK